MWNVGLVRSLASKQSSTPLVGPWFRLPSNPVNLSNGYAENPIVSQLNNGLYLAIFDLINGEQTGFGFTYSKNGIDWEYCEDVLVPGGVRTPLGLIPKSQQDPNKFYFTLFFSKFDSTTNYENIWFADAILIM